MASGTGYPHPYKEVENAVEEDHNEEGTLELEPIVASPAAFGSPDPDTSSYSVNVPLDEHPAVLLEKLSDDYGQVERVFGDDADSVRSQAAVGAQLSDEELNSIDIDDDATTQDELKRVARHYGLAVGGSKKQLRDRIAEHRENEEMKVERTAALNSMSREELDEAAMDAAEENGFEDFNPEHYANMDELREAILAMEAGNDPQPGSKAPAEDES